MSKHGGWIPETVYFYKQQTMRPLSTKAQALWHYLMYRANNVHWTFPIILRLGEIAAACDFSIASAQRAREELAKNYYLVYESRGGSRSAAYTVLSNIYPGQAVQAGDPPKEELGLEKFNPAAAFFSLADIHDQELYDNDERSSHDTDKPAGKRHVPHVRKVALDKSQEAVRRSRKKKRRRRT